MKSEIYIIGKKLFIIIYIMGNNLKGIPKGNLEERNGELFLDGELSDGADELTQDNNCLKENKNKTKKIKKLNKIDNNIDNNKKINKENKITNEDLYNKDNNINKNKVKLKDNLKNCEKNKREKEQSKIDNKDKIKRNKKYENINVLNNSKNYFNNIKIYNKSINDNLNIDNNYKKENNKDKFPYIKLKKIKINDNLKENKKLNNHSFNNSNYNYFHKINNNNIKSNIFQQYKNQKKEKEIYKYNIKENNNKDYYKRSYNGKVILPNLYLNGNNINKKKSIYFNENSISIYKNNNQNKSDRNKSFDCKFKNKKNTNYLDSKIKIMNNSCDNITYNNSNKNLIIPKIKNEIFQNNYFIKNNLNIGNKKKDITKRLESEQKIYRYISKFTIKAHNSEITCMTLLKLNNEFATGSFDKKIKLWKISDINYDLTLISELEGHEDNILSLKFINNVNKLISTSKDKTLKIWDILHLNCIQTLKYHESSVLTCTYIPLEIPYEIISAGEDQYIIIWDKFFNTNNKKIEYKVKKILKGHTDFIYTLLFVNEYQYLISGSKDETIRVWDYKNNYKCIDKINDLNTGITCLKYNYINFNINKYVLIASCEDGSIYFIDIERMKKIKKILFSKYTVNYFDINENYLLTASNDNKARIYCFENKMKETLKGHIGGVSSIIKLNNNVIITSSFDSTIKIWI